MARTRFVQREKHTHRHERRTQQIARDHTSNPANPPLRPSALANSDQLAAAVDKALDSCLAKSTLDGYASAVARFQEYCDAKGVEDKLRFPTAESILSAYAASFAGVAAGKTAASAISALKTWHALHNQPWQGSTRLTYVLRAVSNLAPATSKKPPRAGVDRNAINILHECLDLTDPFDAAVYAVAVLAFWGQCRLGELLGTSRIRHDASALPSRSSIAPVTPTSKSITLSLPRTKTFQTTGEKLFISTQHGRADPIYALRNHLYVNKTLPPNSHLFSYKNVAGGIRCLAKEPFLKRCNDVSVGSRYPRFLDAS
ncbi:hypothetical protein BDV93DRAFT_456389 [Ceratobasidium sp. AG-I]|nr:hypothetical protein BDV93DRAFT_456389 [Ceratobasidium sp. AG-I]